MNAEAARRFDALERELRQLNTQVAALIHEVRKAQRSSWGSQPPPLKRERRPYDVELDTEVSDLEPVQREQVLEEINRAQRLAARPNGWGQIPEDAA